MPKSRTGDVWSGISALADRHGLSAASAKQLRSLADLLANHPLAPTTIREPLRVLDDHLADSLVALELPALAGASAIADLGSGAGLPGLPLAIALPQTQISLVESNARKCAFIDHAVDTCGIANARSVPARAESWTDGVGRFDVVTARALAPLAVVAEYAAPLLRVGASLVAWRGKREPEDEASAARAAQILGLSVLEPVRVAPYKSAQNRYLHVMLKVMDTPERFPRRPGMARKHPLGGRAASDRTRR